MLTISIWPLIQATCKGVNPLVLHRFTLLLRNTDGSTPLHLACYNGHIDIVNILLKCNSSVNLCNTDGSTPLHLACYNGNIDIVNILLKCNSSVNVNYIYIAIYTSKM
jgi:ankyrin repeat protein